MLKRLMLTTILATGCCMSVEAKEYDKIFVFGDSLSDTGNLFEVAGQPPAPYYMGRFSNGPIWVDRLVPNIANITQVPTGTHLNFSFGGAETGQAASPPGFLAQVFGLLGPALNGGVKGPDEHSLISVWIGANDYLGLLGATPTPVDIATAIGTAAGQTTAGISQLYALGGREFLIFNLPDLALTPRVNGLDATEQAAATAISTGHDTAWRNMVGTLQGSLEGSNFIYVDAMALFDHILANPAAFGFSNTTEACILVAACVAADTASQNGYIFWDTIHPTSSTHAVIAQAVVEIVNTDNHLTGILSQSETGHALAKSMMRPLTARLTELHGGKGGSHASGSAMTLGNDRLIQVARANTGYASDGTSGGGGTSSSEGGLSMFFNAQYVNGERTASEERSGFDYDFTVLTLGADYRMEDNMVLGLAFTYGTGDVAQSLGGGYDQKSWQIAGYASMIRERYFFDVYAAYGKTDYENILRPTFVGPITAAAETEGNHITLGTNIGLRMSGEYGRVEPFVGLRYMKVDVDGYDEAQAVIFNLAVGKQEVRSFVGAAGVNFAREFHTESFTFTPKITVAYEHEFDGERTLTGSIIGNTANAVSIHNEALADDIALVGVGVEAHMGGFNLSVEYQTEFGIDGGEHYELVGQVSFRF